MTRGPPDPPERYSEPYLKQYPPGIVNLFSLFLVVIGFALIHPYRVIEYVQRPIMAINSASNFIDIWFVGVLIVVVALTLELHEQSHVLFSHLRGLDPIYRRKKGYTIPVEKEFYGRLDAVIITSAPIFLISLPSLVLVRLDITPLLTLLMELVFILNASMVAKDIPDIAYSVFLPNGCLYWVTDRGGEGETWVIRPE